MHVQELTPNTTHAGCKTHENVTSANFRCRIAFSVSSSAILSSLTYNQGPKQKTCQHSACLVILKYCEGAERIARKVGCQIVQFLHMPPRQDKATSGRPG
ncbi:hypothetical protein LEMLEM_LOCUS20189, partial [Lemmus lemmus]